MTSNGFGQMLALLTLLVLLTKPLGIYMAAVFEGRRTFASRLILPIERLIYRIKRIHAENDQLWTTHAGSCLAFTGELSAVLRDLTVAGAPSVQSSELRHALAMGGSTPMTADLAFNIAVSFMMNTSWQAYSGESELSYFAQMAGICAQSFTSAAAGIAVAIAMIRGFVRQSDGRLGNFWVDVTRSIVYILLPLSFFSALVLCSQGVIQNLSPYRTITTTEGSKQIISLGPVASQEPIKLLSSDGGGFFNANSAHPFENPTPLTNLFEMLLILAIPAALTHTFGRMARAPAQGWALFAAMLILFVCGSVIASWSEQCGNPALLDGKSANI